MEGVKLNIYQIYIGSQLYDISKMRAIGINPFLVFVLSAAMEILTLIGFNEDVESDEIGKAEAYIVLKRNDPGLLWLAKSSLEACIAY